MHFPLRKGRHPFQHDSATLLALFDNAPFATAVVAHNGAIVLANAECERLFGYQRGELIGAGIDLLLPEAGRTLSQPPYLAVTREADAIRNDGAVFRVELHLAQLQTEQGELLTISIRQLPVAEPHFDETRARLEAIPDPLISFTDTGKITEVNESAVAAAGLARDTLIGSDFSACFTDSHRAASCLREIFATGAVRNYPLTLRHRDGGLSELLVNGAAYRDRTGRIVGGVVVARDVTSARQVTEEYAEAKNYLDNILQSSTKYSIVGMDKDCLILSWNEGGRRNYGYRAEEIIGKHISALHTAEDVASGAVDRLMARALEMGVAEGEFTRVRKDGSHFEASVVVNRRNDVAGAFIGYLLMSSDISDKKEAEDRLRQAALYARSIIEASLDPLVTINTEGKITDVNEAMVRGTGVPREEMVGSDFAPFFNDSDKAREGYRQVFQKGHVTDYPLTMRHRSGTLTEVLYNFSVYRDTSGAVIGALAAGRDVTQRKRLDEELIEAANILGASSAQIMATIAEVVSGATETAATVSETTAVAEEVKMTAQISSRKARAVLDVARQAVEMAQSGRSSVDQSVAGMGRIREQMASIAESVARLSEQTEAIGEIIETVKDLAEQSNLLSVNAAIEAAKAGEVGKGFDVVAQEVKSLAAESKKATAQVRSILNDIQKATKAAVQAAEEGHTGVETGVRQTTDAGEVIRHMAESIEHSAEAAAEIASSTQEHLTGMDQIALAMGNIREASDHNVAGMRQVEETLQNLHSLGRKLKELVEQY